MLEKAEQPTCNIDNPEECEACGSQSMSTAKKSNPALWKRIVSAVTAGTKGGRAGQWSARKAQMLAKQYKAQGGGYT